MRNIPYCTECTSKYKNQVQPKLPCPLSATIKGITTPQ